MNKGKIAVDNNLSPVRSLLQEKGYDVVSMNDYQQADCIVVSGGADNLMGIQTTKTKAPVINAEGKSAQDIVSEVSRYVQ